MSISVGWYDNEKTILYLRLEDRWDWKSYDAAWQQLHKLVDSATKPIGLIVLIPEQLVLPRNVISEIQSRRYNVRLEVVLRVVATRNDFARAALRILMMLNPGLSDRLRLVRTEEEALALLKEQLAYGGK